MLGVFSFVITVCIGFLMRDSRVRFVHPKDFYAFYVKGDVNFSWRDYTRYQTKFGSYVLIFCSVLQFLTIALQQFLVYSQISQRGC